LLHIRTSVRTDGVLAGFHPFMKLALARKVALMSPPPLLAVESTMAMKNERPACRFVTKKSAQIRREISLPTNEKANGMRGEGGM
jgi:hypothetical protein